MDIGIIGLAAMVILGALMYFVPQLCTKADLRDDPEALAKVKKLGAVFMGCAVAAALYMLRLKSV